MKNFITKEIIIWFLVIVVLFLIGTILKVEYSLVLSSLSLITSIFVLAYNRKLELDKIKLSSYTLVTKLQYDLEFKIYTEIYGMLKNYLDVLIIIYKDLYVQSREKLEKSIDTYEITTVTITDYTYKNKPFYEKKIFDKIEKIIILSNEMWLMSKNHISGKLVSLVIFENKLKELQVHLDELSELIRQRIENMKIVED